MKILVIDDDSTLRAAIELMLDAMGAVVVTAAGAEEGMAHLRRGRFDYVLVDMKMPVKDGLWFLQHAVVPPHTKVVVISAFVPGLLLKEMFRLGACDYLEKPFDAEELLEMIERHSGARAQHQALQGLAA